MPILTAAIAADGPVIPILIGVSGPRAQALKDAGLAIPTPVLVRGLIDTGASCTAVDPQVIADLGLEPRGTISIVTPSTGTGSHTCNQYDVALVFLMHPGGVHVKSLTLPVIESHLDGQGIRAFIGRDALADGIMIYNSQSGTLSLAF